LWSPPQSAIYSEPMTSYINLEFGVTPEKQKTTSGSCNLLGVRKLLLFGRVESKNCFCDHRGQKPQFIFGIKVAYGAQFSRIPTLAKTAH
jgi:hypothetical protein